MPKKVKRKKRVTAHGSPKGRMRLSVKPKARKLPRVKKTRQLTERDRRFIEEYLCCFDARTAAIRAGFKPKQAFSTGYKLLKDSRVRTEMERLRKVYAKRVEWSRERILSELGKIAFADIGNYVKVKSGGIVTIKSWDDISPQARGAIQEIIPTKDGCRVKLYSKDRALELLGKFRALFVDRHEVSGHGGGAIRLYIPENSRGKNGAD